jgi:hypothetical protein
VEVSRYLQNHQQEVNAGMEKLIIKVSLKGIPVSK